jgi:hypothetical protein
MAAGLMFSVLVGTLMPSLADTSGLSRGAIAAEPLLYATSCESTPQGTECSILLQFFAAHNSGIYSTLHDQQPLLNADPDLYRDWLRLASAASSVVQLLYQALLSKDYLTSFDEEQGRCREFSDTKVSS